MDVVLLARLQFALTIAFHYLFPPLTIGMGMVMVFLEGRFVCADLLQPAERFGRLYPELLRGYALEALVSANKRDFFVKNGIDHLLPPDSQACTDFDPESAALLLFAELMDAEFSVQSAVDLGEDIRLESRSVSGSGLAWNDELLQVSLFPRQAA